MRFDGRIRSAQIAALALGGALQIPLVHAGESTAAVDLGRRSYVSYCARCHGLNLVTTGLGSDLRVFPRDDKARFVRAVNKGVRAMPAWEGIVKPEVIEAIWAYVGSINGWPAADAPK